jgi:hypothetical protein
MRYFVLLDFQHMVLAFFLGLLASLFVYLAWRGYPARAGEEESPDEEPTGGRCSASPPIPPLLVLVFVGAILWLLAYVLIRGIYGGAIS